MLLRPAQVALFWKLWAGACSVQGWMGAEKEVRRKEVLKSLGFDSLKSVDSTYGFDAVKARLLTLQYRLEGGTGEAFPDVGLMRRHLHLIETNLLPRLAGFVDAPEAYVDAIAADKFGHRGPWRSLADHPDRGPGQIEHLLFTLTRAISRLARSPDRVSGTPRASRPSKTDKPLKSRASGPSFGQIVPPFEPPF